jgi:hypothetical protein
VLDDLIRQLEDGRIYDRDLVTIGGALNAAYHAYNGRPFVRNVTGRKSDALTGPVTGDGWDGEPLGVT